ncbi:flowering time control protein FPA [Iris pallida]|uniref:Flowering time control protein FPA n=1 Tax=Iris pallida TaxID=29817 RepID=A0AAX6DG75_IRIPA|nr:flowering time control protein FPA [Iris pallida]
MIPSSSGIRPGIGPIWDDGFDMRESKRSRIYDDEPYHGRRLDDEPYRGRRLDDEPVHHDPGRVRRSPDIDHVWRGIIAKGGAHVCQARCVPIGKGLDFTLPEVVNCSARTDLDALAKHYAEAIGFDVVFFIPDSEDDFASYTEFLRYLGLKSRAGVAKFDDGATMFLVPPSDFLTHVLKVSGPERLYGVVLKLPQQQLTAATPQRLQAAALPPPHYGEQQRGSISQDGYGYIPQEEDPAFRTDYDSNMRENSITHAWDVEPRGDVPCSVPSASHDYRRNPEGTSQVGVSLTPELIATLASLIPTNNQFSAAGNIQTPASSAARSSSAMNDSSIFAQGWSQQDQVTYSGTQLEMTNNTHQPPQQHQEFGGQQQQPQQFSHQYGNQLPHMSQYPAYGSTQGDDLGLNMPQTSYEPYSTHETIRAPDTGVVFNQHLQYQSAPTNASAEGQARRVMQTQMALPSSSDNANYSAHTQQLRNALNNSGEGPSQGTDDRNLRYQSTLQFAASLLEKINQDNRGGSQNVDGSGNQ